jgi:ribosomal protein L37AE/L43A
MEKRVVLCPFCDREQEIELEKNIVRCMKCGGVFNTDPYDSEHPREFWSSPDTSARF